MQQTLLLVGLACLIGAVVGGGSKLAGIEIPFISSTLRQALLGLIGVVLIGSVERVRLVLKSLLRKQPLVLAVVGALGALAGVGGTLIAQRAFITSPSRTATTPSTAGSSLSSPLGWRFSPDTKPAIRD